MLLVKVDIHVHNFILYYDLEQFLFVNELYINCFSGLKVMTTYRIICSVVTNMLLNPVSF